MKSSLLKVIVTPCAIAIDIWVLRKLWLILKPISNNLLLLTYVLNMDRDDYQGTHWICLYVNGKNAVYHDSFGQEAPIEIVNFCKRGKVKLIMNYTQIQDIDDTSCGYYCLAFLYWMTKYKTPSQYYLNMFNKPFDENTKKNKLILQKFIKSIVYKKT